MMMAAITAVKLLLVEDDPDTGDVMARAFRKAGFEVDLCVSAGAALVELEMSPRPAAAVIDLGLPDAAGEIVLWRIRRDYARDVPVAVVTGAAEPLSRRDLQREQPDVIFPKPVDLKALVDWLKSVT